MTDALQNELYPPRTKVYSKVTKMMKIESNTARARISLLKELFMSFEDNTVIVRRFPSSPKVPIKGYNITLRLNHHILVILTIQMPSNTRLHLSAVSSAS